MTEPCPYCGSQVLIRDSSVIYHGKSFGLVWICSKYPACDAYVGVHTGTTRPLGRLANAELREWKKRAHSCLDPLWKSKRYSRKTAYSIASDLLAKPVSKTHIGMFDVQECKDLIESLKQLPFQLP